MVQQRTSILEDLEDENLNLTPLIDCVFLLLIFFMVTTVFKQPYSLRGGVATGPSSYHRRRERNWWPQSTSRVQWNSTAS